MISQRDNEIVTIYYEPTKLGDTAKPVCYDLSCSNCVLWHNNSCYEYPTCVIDGGVWRNLLYGDKITKRLKIRR